MLARRYLFLLALGVAHGTLLFFGDILTMYALSAFVLLPSGMRGRVEGWLSLRANQVGALYRVGLLAFIGFGAARFAWFFFSGERFP